jgi:hypothetical protein
VAVAALGLNLPNVPPALLVGGGSVLLLGSARRSAAWKLALAWMSVPLFTHLFLVFFPGTHYREIMPGLLLLVSREAVGLYDRLAGRAARLIALLAGGILLAASLHYVYTAWIRPWPEYQLTFPLDRHPLDWTRAESRSAGGTFGAARRHGWKVVSELVSAGELPARYTTNERPAEAAWYLKSSWICDEQAELFILAPRFPRDRQLVEQGGTLPGYQLAGRVYVDDHPTLSLLTRQAPPGGPRMYRSEDFGRLFDRELASPWTPVGRLYRPGLNSAPICPAS